MTGKTWLGSLAAVVFIASNLSAAEAKLKAGNYVSNLTPAIDEKAADSIEKQVFKISGLEAIDVKPADSTLHFSVKENASVDVARIASAVRKAAPGVSASQPLMATEAAAPGESGTSGTSGTSGSAAPAPASPGGY